MRAPAISAVTLVAVALAGGAFADKTARTPKLEKRRGAFWRVDQIPGGHRPDYFEGGDITPSQRGPVFATPQEGEAWLQARGCRQDPVDPDHWLDR